MLKEMLVLLQESHPSCHALSLQEPDHGPNWVLLLCLSWRSPPF